MTDPAARPGTDAFGLRSLSDAALFVAMVDCDSLSAAARRLDCTPAALSKRLAALELRLGAQLIWRSTRRFVPTEAGLLFAQKARAALLSLGQAEAEVAGNLGAMRGVLRVSVPISFGRRHIAPLVAGFQQAFPEVELHLRLADDDIDPVAQGQDLVLTVGRPRDGGLAVRRILHSPRVACAAPAYLQRRGIPRTPMELSGHDCILLQRGDEVLDRWMFLVDGQMQSVRVAGRLVTNSGEVSHAWAVSGCGIALKALWDIEDDLTAGRLVEVLSDARVDALEIFAVYPDRRYMSARAKAFVDFISPRLQQGSPLPVVA